MADIANKRHLWQARIEECQNSPMSAKQWCQQNQVAYSTYLYWARKLRLTPELEQKAVPEDTVFAQLPTEREILKGLQGTKAPISMFLGTVRIEISSSCPQNLLQSFVEILNRYA